MRWPHNDFIAGHILLRKVAHSEESELSGERLLTPRELHVLNLIEKGLSNKEIARALCVEIATVKNHVHQILSKTRARRRGQAIHMCSADELRI
jgi:two-component system nitrate/nitrite response regulator NarL